MTDTQTPDAGDGIVVTTAADLLADESQQEPEAEAASPEDVAEAEAEESESSTEEEADHEEKVPKGLKKRFGEFTSRIRQAEADKAALQEQLEKALGALNQLADGKPAQKQKREGAPEFGDYVEDGVFDGAAYQAALVEYEVERRFAEREARETAARKEQAIRASEAEFAKTHPNYGDAIAAISSDPIFRALASEIVDSPEAPAIAYHLATHPEELQTLARMPRAQALMQLGRITAKRAAPSERKAPEPIKPVQAAKGDFGGYLGRQDLSQKDWEARREKDLGR